MDRPVPLVQMRSNPCYLMFLVAEPDGRHAPVTGQTDPATFSILEARGFAQQACRGPAMTHAGGRRR